MNTNEFNEKLKAVAGIVGTDKADTLFMSSYESLLKDVQALPAGIERYQMAARMRKLLDHQLQYETNRWLALSRHGGMN